MIQCLCNGSAYDEGFFEKFSKKRVWANEDRPHPFFCNASTQEQADGRN